MSRILRSAAMIISICAVVAGAVKEAWRLSTGAVAAVQRETREAIVHVTGNG